MEKSINGVVEIEKISNGVTESEKKCNCGDENEKKCNCAIENERKCNCVVELGKGNEGIIETEKDLTDNQINCEAVENDWLDIVYVEKFFKKESKRKGSDSPNTKQECKMNFLEKTRKTGIMKWMTKRRISVAVSAICLIALCAVTLITTDTTMKEWFSQAQQTYTYGTSGLKGVYCFDLLATQTIESVEEGNVVISGGTLALALCSGKVSAINENALTIEHQSGIKFVYENLSNVDVALGDSVNEYDIIGSYSQMTSVYAIKDGEKIYSVSIDGRTLTWAI